jgi:outer membrane receptor for ferrienterochelin and colicin
LKILSIKKTLLILGVYAVSIYAQGILKGMVTDSLTSDQLKGAEIILTGTTYRAVSNINGEFYIAGIPAGDYILQASYLGYNEKKILVTIKSEETQILNIELLPNITNGTDLSSQLKSQAEEINLQINSSTIKNVISGKKLQDMPDENIPVALSRLPGVSIVYKYPSFPLTNRSGWEINAGEYKLGILFPPLDNFPIVDDPTPSILIRGLDSKFANITIDGVRIPSTSANDKSLDLSIIPGRDFQNIELQKTITSNEDADATAGVINLATGKAPRKRRIEAELLGNYNKLDKSANQYNFTGSYSERFLSNMLGVQANVSLERKILSNEYLYNPISLLQSYNLSYTNTVRKRYRANILFDLNTPDGGSIKFNNIFDKTHTNYFDYIADSTLSTTPKYIFRNMETEQRILFSSIEGSNHLFGFDVDWDAAFTESKNDHPFNYSLTFLGPPRSSQLGREFNLSNSIDNPSKNYTKEKTTSIDFFKKYNLGKEITDELKFGGKYRINSRLYDEDLRAENASLLGNNQYMKLADGSFVKKDFSGTRFYGLVGKSKNDILLSYFQDNPPGERTLFDKYNIPLINMDALRLWRQLNYNPYYENDGVDINSYDFSESVLAGYVIHQLNFGQSAMFITGLRVESEQNNSSGYYFPNTLTDPADLYNGIPKQTNTYYYNKTTVLPNFQMILKPDNFLNMRLAAYKTLIRPDYNARIPKFFKASSNAILYLNMGNPDLKNADVWNYEFQTQFYGNGIGQFSINAFYKDIKGMQKATNGIQLSGLNQIDSLGITQSPFPVGYPFTAGSFNFYSYYNSPKPTHIWGFEIEHKTNFRYLPGFLKNITLNYNLTFLRSETWTMDIITVNGESTKYILSDHKGKLNNIPEFFANAILGYDIKGFSLRISYFYQDRYPISDSFNGLQTVQNKFSRLDIAASQQILRNISIILNLNNITNSNEESLYGGVPDEPWQTVNAYGYGMNVDFGIEIDF